MLCFLQSGLIPEGDGYVGVQKAIQRQSNWETESLLISMEMENAAVEPNFSYSQSGWLGKHLQNKHNEWSHSKK